MLGVQMIVAIMVFAANVAILIVSVRAFPPDALHVGTYKFGNCRDINRINSAIHVALNIASSAFLGAGNYCMQILVAPSRAEIDRAHEQKVSLDIGVLSIRNLSYVKRRRLCAWIILGIFSALLHLFWNSAFFASIPIAAIPRAVVTSDFRTNGENWTISDPLGHASWFHTLAPSGDGVLNRSLIYSLQSSSFNFTKLDPRECIMRNIDPTNATSSLVVVAKNMTSQENGGSSLIEGWISQWEFWTFSTGWMCTGYTVKIFCDAKFASSFADNWVLQTKSNHNVLVDYCLASDEANNQERCGLHYMTHILAFICCCTFASCLMIGWVWTQYIRRTKTMQGKMDNETMMTMGDTIYSFLHSPKRSQNYDDGDEGDAKPGSTFVRARRTTWQPKARVRWYKAITPLFWTISMILFIAALAGTAVAIGILVRTQKIRGQDVSPYGIWKQGFKVNPSDTSTTFGALTMSLVSRSKQLWANIVVANSLQLIVSFLYLFYNNILTRQLVADEWTRYLRPDGKKTLRVSSPTGMQRSSYFLSLPWKYATPLIGLSILLHWLISQGIFLIQTTTFGPGANGERYPEYDTTSRGFSLLGAILGGGVGAAMIVALVLNSVIRSYENIPPQFQLMGYNSSAIEAMCDRPEDDSEAYMFPISIGLVDGERDQSSDCIKKLTFSTDIDLDQAPQKGTAYIGPDFLKKAESQREQDC
ncbi:hypothetical protein HDV63DRAFT_398161 [Trichoderma sp. SZMC 28014]